VRASLCALARGIDSAECARARLRSARGRAARQTGPLLDLQRLDSG
jgi:hypothetical protein